MFWLKIFMFHRIDYIIYTKLEQNQTNDINQGRTRPRTRTRVKQDQEQELGLNKTKNKNQCKTRQMT